MADADKKDDNSNQDNAEKEANNPVKEKTKDDKKKTSTPRKDKSKAESTPSKSKTGAKPSEPTPRTEKALGKQKKDDGKQETKEGKIEDKPDSSAKETIKESSTHAKDTDGTTEEKKTKFEFPCDACASEGENVDSTNYCNECAENICGACVKQHKKFPAMKTHTILGKTSRRRSSTIKTDDGETSSQQKLLECENHRGKPVEMYCQHHDTVWCPVCMAVHHRSCESVSFITDNCKSITRTKECKDLRVSIRKLKKEVDVMLAKVLNNAESLAKRKDDVLNTIKVFRKRIETKLAEIEAETVKQLNDVFDKNTKEINKDVEDFKKASSELEEMEIVMDIKPTDTNADHNMFVFMKRANPRMKNANEIMQKVSRKLGDERIKFFLDTRLDEWIEESYQVFGNFLYNYTTENHSIAIPKDKEICEVIDMASLPDGRFLLSDSTNKRLKLFEKDFKYIDHMDMPTTPHGVSALERSSAVVSLPDEKMVQFVNLDPQISLINAIDVGEICRGLSSFEGELYVVCGGLEGECQGHIRIYNLAGEIMRSIERDNLGKVLFTTPVNVCVSHVTGNIHVTDKKRGIISMKQSGELLPEVTDKALRSPWGICEDDKRQLFVTGHSSDDIWQIRDSTPLGAILTAKDGIREPLCISYIPSSSKLVVAMKKCNDMIICTPITTLPQDGQSEVKGQDKHKLRHKAK